MWEQDLCVSEIYAVLDLKWPPRHQRAMNRTQHALSFRLEGGCDFTHEGSSFSVAAKDILFVPRQYDYWQDARRFEHLICVHFDMSGCTCTEPMLHTPLRPQFFERYFTELLQLWTTKPIGYRYAAKSLINRIFEGIVTEQQSQRPSDSLMAQIVAYLNQNISSPELSVAGLARMAGVSETQLRQLFHGQYGCSPHRYIANLRVQYARSLLSGGYYTVEETAALCGFSGAKNFATFIRKETGSTPRELK